MRLPAVLTEDDFSIAELTALRLDGDLFALGDSYLPSDSPPDAAARARSLAHVVTGERVADRRTAAWIHGAAAHCPRPLSVCLPAGRSHSADAMRGVVQRESGMTVTEVISVGGVSVTSPVRTALDIVRERVYSPADEAAVRSLLALAEVTPDELSELLADRRFMRERLRARARLESLV